MVDDFEPKKAEISDYWNLLLRQRWSLLGPFFVLGWITFAVARWYPYLYRSDALILVEQQKVPEQYVTPNVISDLQDRLESMKQQILSRTRLERLIEQFNLYPQERPHMLVEDLVNKMRADIRIEPLQARGRPGDLTAFHISYAAKSPRVAQQVSNELTSLFIEENLQARTQQSEGTTAFLENQLEQARKDLAVQEARQREYKLRYLGQLPEQQQANLQILSSLEIQLHAASDSLDRAEQQRIYLESMREQYRSLERSLGSGTVSSGVDPLLTAKTAISNLKKQLTDLQAKYTPSHPDMIRIKENIAQWEELERKLQGEKVSKPKTDAEAATTSAAADPALIEAESRLKAVGVELEDRQKEIDSIRARIRELQSRLNLTPVREQQLAEVTRAYENSRQYYQSLLQKKLQSELATNLEKRQQGEQFRILDPASLPNKADEPSRLEILVIGWAVGLCTGIGLMVFREFRDDVVRSEEDARASTNLPVLVHIPVLRTPREETWRRWLRPLEFVAILLLVTLSLGTGIYTYMFT